MPHQGRSLLGAACVLAAVVALLSSLVGTGSDVALPKIRQPGSDLQAIRLAGGALTNAAPRARASRVIPCRAALEVRPQVPRILGTVRRSRRAMVSRR